MIFIVFGIPTRSQFSVSLRLPSLKRLFIVPFVLNDALFFYFFYIHTYKYKGFQIHQKFDIFHYHISWRSFYSRARVRIVFIRVQPAEIKNTFHSGILLSDVFDRQVSVRT